MMSRAAEKYLSTIQTLLGMLLLFFFWPGGLRTQASNQESKAVPEFEEYSVAETWKGPPMPVRLTSREERMFRTTLQEAAKQPPNFAGHYRFVIWGCGTRCVGGALIDLRMGKIFPPPLGHKKPREEHWIFCTDWDKSKGAEYRLSSRLFILHCGEETHYFLWENNTYREIAHSP